MAPFSKIVGGARSAVSVASDLAKHVVWYVRHQIRDSSR